MRRQPNKQTKKEDHKKKKASKAKTLSRIRGRKERETRHGEH
jgi:hypothetical protein